MKPPLSIKELFALIQLKCLNKNYVNWEEVKTNQNPNKAYKIFPIIIQSFFSGKKRVISKKDLKSP